MEHRLNPGQHEPAFHDVQHGRLGRHRQCERRPNCRAMVPCCRDMGRHNEYEQYENLRGRRFEGMGHVLRVAQDRLDQLVHRRHRGKQQFARRGRRSPHLLPHAVRQGDCGACRKTEIVGFCGIPVRALLCHRPVFETRIGHAYDRGRDVRGREQQCRMG